MATLVELTANLVSAHASGSTMTTEDLLKELQTVYKTLKALEAGEMAPEEAASTEPVSDVPKFTIKQAFKKDEVICMACGKGGFKTLKRHLQVAHDMKPGQYRKAFNIPAAQILVAKNYSEQRKKDALERGQGDVLVKARAARAAKNAAVPEVKVKSEVPAVKVKPPVPAVKEKAPVPAVKKKAGLPAKVEAAATAAKVQKPAARKPAVKAKK
jgi:predicted transcriptional regulator